MSISEAMQEAQAAEALASEREAALNIINTAETQQQAEGSADGNTQEGNQSGNDNQPQSLVTSVQSLVFALNTSNQENAELRRSLATMAAKAVDDNPQTVIKKQLTVFGPGTTATHRYRTSIVRYAKTLEHHCQQYSLCHTPYSRRRYGRYIFPYRST